MFYKLTMKARYDVSMLAMQNRQIKVIFDVSFINFCRFGLALYEKCTNIRMLLEGGLGMATSE